MIGFPHVSALNVAHLAPVKYASDRVRMRVNV